jgi:uncharacterized protein YndB with AHSA1/START domain
MKEELTAKKTINIDANPSKVWEALTDPKVIKQYFFGTEAESQWRVGSAITFKGKWEGKHYIDKGTILMNDPYKKLQFSYWSSLSGMDDDEKNYSKITYQLLKKKDQTVLTVTQDKCASKETKNHSENNWSIVLNTLKDIVEKDGQI